MDPLKRINFLIDQHVEVPYAICPGCEHCEEIEKISKEIGLREENYARKSVESKKRIQNFTKDQLKRYLDEGVTIKEISRREKFSEITIRRKIQQWFPDHYKKKKPDLIPIDTYKQLKAQGYNDGQIAKKVKVAYHHLKYQVTKWRKEGKLSRQAMQSI